MSKRWSDHDDGGAEYRETYDESREVRKVLDRARGYAKERGFAFVVFLGDMLTPGQNLKPHRAYRDVEDAREEARDLTRSGYGWPKASVKIKTIRIP